MSELTIDLFTCIYYFLSPFCLRILKVSHLIYISPPNYFAEIQNSQPTFHTFFFQKPHLKIGSFPKYYKLLEMATLAALTS